MKIIFALSFAAFSAQQSGAAVAAAIPDQSITVEKLPLERSAPPSSE